MISLKPSFCRFDFLMVLAMSLMHKPLIFSDASAMSSSIAANKS